MPIPQAFTAWIVPVIWWPNRWPVAATNSLDSFPSPPFGAVAVLRI